nr:MAG TPA: hypothetical protein [Caudoviricetes sp.]
MLFVVLVDSSNVLDLIYLTLGVCWFGFRLIYLTNCLG